MTNFFKNTNFESGSKGRQVVSILLLLGIVILIGNSLTLLVGFVAGGFDTDVILQEFSIYQDILLGGAILVAIAFFIEFFITKYDDRYGSSVFFSAIGKFPSNSFFKRFSGTQITWISIFVFGIIGLITSQTQQTSFIGFAQLGQQFTEVSSILFSGLLVPVAENLQWLGFLAMIVVLFRIAARYFQISKEDFKLWTMVIMIVGGGLLGLSNHMLRYGSSDFNLLIVFIVWAIGGALTFFTGSFTPFWVYHIMNNLFFDLKRFLSSDATMTIAIVVFAIIGIMYFVVYGKNWAGDSIRARGGD